nr:ABC transporter permease [Natronolimnobius sp. AArcel1]
MFAGAIFSIVLATFWGVFSGYKGGSVDGFMMAVADVVMTIPGLPLVVVLAAIIEPTSPWVIGIILVVNAWAGFARSLRSEVLKLRRESYVEASRTIGISMPAIVTKDVLPNVMPLIVVNFVTTARNVIMASVGLYFLGLLPHTGLNWGVMMDNAYGQGAIYTTSMFHWFYAPMVTIVLLSLGLLLLGQGLDRIFNPRIRARHSESTSDEESTEEPADDVSVADQQQQGGL